MSNELEDFQQFMKQREEIARAYVQGDAAPINSIATQNAPATFFGPGGGRVEGAKEVASSYEKGAASFDIHGESNLEILQMAASDGIAYWVGFQHATAYFRGNPEAVPMKLRITELFRREGNEWKLVHRHADMLAEEQKK